MVTSDDGYSSQELHDLQHPAQNTARCSGHWPQPLAWDVSERQQTAANVTESSGGEVGTKTLLHVRDRLGRDYRHHECLQTPVLEFAVT